MPVKVGVMRALIACEFSGIVRESFRRRGHDAWSLDLLDSEDHSKFHFCDYDLTIGQKYDDMLQLNHYGLWDMVIAFPPCTHLAASGARWFKNKQDEQAAAIHFVKSLAAARAERVAIENPVGVLSTKWRKPDQIIQPWQFGHGETKATCLWLKNLPKLAPTKIVEGREPRVHHASPGPDRWKERSRTLLGIADAMAEQWGSL
jgi:site-specific DNA-cytosine methylase